MGLKAFLKTAHYRGISEDRFWDNKVLLRAELELGSMIQEGNNLICRAHIMSNHTLDETSPFDTQFPAKLTGCVN